MKLDNEAFQMLDDLIDYIDNEAEHAKGFHNLYAVLQRQGADDKEFIVAALSALLNVVKRNEWPT